jgi:hypothetical protein
MPGPLGSLVWIPYVSDDTNTYQIRTDTAVATLLGATPEAFLAHPQYPKQWKPRHYYGVQSDGTRVRIRGCNPIDANFVSGGTFTFRGHSYTVEGQVGEKRKA